MTLRYYNFGPTRQWGIRETEKYRLKFLHDFPAGGKTEVLCIKDLPDRNVVFGLADTHLEVYSPSHSAVLPHGDQIVAQAFREAIISATDETTTSIALRANQILRAKLEAINRNRFGKLPLIDLDDAARIPGAAVVIVKTDFVAREVEIFQTCDAGAMYESGNGLEIAPYRNHRVERYHQEKVQVLLAETGGDKRKMWDEFFGFLSESRRKENNKSEEVVILNGTAAFERWVSSQVIHGELESGLMFTDGALFDPWAFPAERHRLLAQWLENPDIESFLGRSREMQKALVGKTHVYGGFPEASLVEFAVWR